MYGAFTDVLRCPLKGVVISIKENRDNKWQTIFLDYEDNEGCYCINIELPKGEYQIRFSHPGFPDVVQIVTELSGQKPKRFHLMMAMPDIDYVYPKGQEGK